VPTDAPPLAVAAARPTVAVEGQTVAALVDGMTALRIHEGGDGVATLELEVGNWAAHDGGAPDFQFFDRRTVDFGKKITVALGDHRLFAGKIAGVEAVFPPLSSPRLVVLADDGLQALRMKRRTRTWDQVSDGDVARRIASDHGLTPSVDLDGPTHTVLAQLDQSDLAFLRDRARAAGGEVWIDDRTLHVAKRPSRAGGDPPRLALGGAVRELRLRADLAHQATAVVVGGWDVAGKQAISERATDAALGRETAGGDSGASILRSAFAERTETVAATAPVTAAEARAGAEALFRARARRFVSGEGVCETAPGIRAGAAVRLEGVGPLFAGEHVIVECCHRFDGITGMRTEIVLERPALGRPA
jgi:phage protein D